MALTDREYMKNSQNNTSKRNIDEEIFRKHMEEQNEARKRNESNAYKKNENKKQYYSEDMKDEIGFIGNLFKTINNVHAAIIDFSKSDTIFTNAFKIQCGKDNISCAISSYNEKMNNEEHCICIVYTKEIFYYVDCKWKIITNSETDLELYYDKAKKDFIDSMANNKKSEKKEKINKFNIGQKLHNILSRKEGKSFNPARLFLFLPIILLLIFFGSLFSDLYKNWEHEKEKSQQLLMYRFQESANKFFSYRIIDPSLTMSPDIENEIMRIKKEINTQLKYGKTDRLSVKWLDIFDGAGQKPVADCDDFAYLFWEKSQDSELLKGKIFFATTDDEIFAHAFNLIWIGGEWRAIEPQNLDRALDLSYSGYVSITKDAFNKWLEKHQVIIYDVGNMNYSRAAVPLFK